jgi:TRAP-type C4-dicarboxylate transport system permease small subunit
MCLAKLVYTLATVFALIGGMALTLVILMTCVSIAGRALAPLGTGPVYGDFEIAEALTAFVVFCFLPIAQLRGSHATVDLFTNQLSEGPNRVLQAVWEVLMAVVYLLILWRLGVGMVDKAANGETSYLRQFPIWWAYAACALPALAAALVGVWNAVRHVASALSGTPVVNLWEGEPR